MINPIRQLASPTTGDKCNGNTDSGKREQVAGQTPDFQLLRKGRIKNCTRNEGKHDKPASKDFKLSRYRFPLSAGVPGRIEGRGWLFELKR